MKKQIFTLIIISAVLVSACEDFIDLNPLDRVSNDAYWKTPGDLERYLLQFYPMLDREPVQNSDELITGFEVSRLMDGQRVLSTGNWSGDWVRVRDINIFFDNYQRVQSDFMNYRHFVGEAHFFKAWIYFNLLKRYGDLPWYTSEVKIDSEEDLLRPRSPRTVVVDSILVHLDKAFEYLNPRTNTGNNKLNKETALAFKTRVALFEGTWQTYHTGSVFGTNGADPNKYLTACIEAAEELMNGNYARGIYSTGDPDGDYFRLFGFDNMTDINEVLLYRAFNAAAGIRNTTQAELTYRTDGRGVTWGLVSSYLGKDGTPYDFLAASATHKGNAFLTKIAADVDNRLKSTIWIPGDLMASATNRIFEGPNIEGSVNFLCPTGFQLKKGANPRSPGAGFDWDVGSETGSIIFRYAEVLLNYAEAKWERDGVVAYNELNLLRARVGMPDFIVNPENSLIDPVNYGYPVPMELYAIRRERAVELAVEGMRDDDYMRWAAHALFKGQRLKGYPIDLVEYPGYPASHIDVNGLIDFHVDEQPVGYRFREDQDYLFPIPQDELTLNPNLKQNPGWQ